MYVVYLRNVCVKAHLCFDVFFKCIIADPVCDFTIARVYWYVIISACVSNLSYVIRLNSYEAS